MGYTKDAGTSTVAKINEQTGYPVDQYGHLLDPEGESFEIGDELVNLTSPYGHLTFAYGNEDDFHCFDWASIKTADGRNFIVLHSVVNSETAAFIQDAEYELLSADTDEQKRVVLRTAFGILDCAADWMYDAGGPIDHDEDGWNQDYHFFVADIAAALMGISFVDKRHPTVAEIDHMRSLVY